MDSHGRDRERGEKEGEDPGRPEGDDPTEGPGNVSVDEPTAPALSPDEPERDAPDEV
ncbi:MAG TPA: hypothetical protein VHK89_01005 [Actinomycetota bacterium]|nr:hypothetical protein [Actinomycetota bacterium]